jgi:hypothetical protein
MPGGPVSSANYSSSAWSPQMNGVVAAGVFVAAILLLIMFGAVGGHLDASVKAG